MKKFKSNERLIDQRLRGNLCIIFSGDNRCQEMSTTDTTANLSASANAETDSTGNTDKIIKKHIDLIRDCSIYKDEHKECKSLKSRFNQYFIFGHYLSCDQWRLDYNNCQKYAWREDKEAARELIISELNRRTKRLKAHYDNDVWKKREHPPDDWSKPLPDFIEERNKNTYLELKAIEFMAEEERREQEIKKLAASDSESKQMNNNSSRSSNKSNFCTFM